MIQYLPTRSPCIISSWIKITLYKPALLFVILLFTGLPLGAVFAKPTITLATAEVGTNLYKNNKQIEYVLDIQKEAFKRIGYDLDIVMLPYERSLKMAEEGLIDGDILRTASIEAQYPGLIRVPEAILEIDLIVISRSPIDLSAGWNALSGKSVGWLVGMKVIEENLPETANLTGARSIEQLSGMLLNKRVDYVVFMRAPGLSFLGKDSQWLIVNEQSLQKVPNYTYLNEKHRHMVPKLATTLRQMKEDGTFMRIIKKHQHNYKEN